MLATSGLLTALLGTPPLEETEGAGWLAVGWLPVFVTMSGVGARCDNSAGGSAVSRAGEGSLLADAATSSALAADGAASLLGVLAETGALNGVSPVALRSVLSGRGSNASAQGNGEGFEEKDCAAPYGDAQPTKSSPDMRRFGEMRLPRLRPIKA